MGKPVWGFFSVLHLGFVMAEVHSISGVNISTDTRFNGLAHPPANNAGVRDFVIRWIEDKGSSFAFYRN
jgi:hypothetical protein